MIQAILAGCFGLIIGSFLNVCIYRMPRDLSVASPSRSFCPACGRTLSWFENIPLLSFVFLRGRCRNCGAGIPLRYPLVELAMGVLFFSTVYWLGPGLLALKYCVFLSIQVALIAMDLEERILADEFTLGGLAVAIVLAAFVPMPEGLIGLLTPPDWPPVVLSAAESVFSAAALSAVLWAIGALYLSIRGREGLGFGDVKMVGMIAAFLGFAPALLTVAVGSVLGSVCGLLFIFVQKKDAASYQLPFGSFLGVAAIAVAFWEQ